MIGAGAYEEYISTGAATSPMSTGDASSDSSSEGEGMSPASAECHITDDRISISDDLAHTNEGDERMDISDEASDTTIDDISSDTSLPVQTHGSELALCDDFALTQDGSDDLWSSTSSGSDIHIIQAPDVIELPSDLVDGYTGYPNGDAILFDSNGTVHDRPSFRTIFNDVGADPVILLNTLIVPGEADDGEDKMWLQVMELSQPPWRKPAMYRITFLAAHHLKYYHTAPRVGDQAALDAWEKRPLKGRGVCFRADPEVWNNMRYYKVIQGAAVGQGSSRYWKFGDDAGIARRHNHRAIGIRIDGMPQKGMGYFWCQSEPTTGELSQPFDLVLVAERLDPVREVWVRLGDEETGTFTGMPPECYKWQPNDELASVVRDQCSSRKRSNSKLCIEHTS